MKPVLKPSDDLDHLGVSLLKGDILKIYYLMIMTGVPAAHANQFIFNLKHSDQRASSVKIRNELITSLKQVFQKIVTDPVLYQRARSLATRNDFNVFEDIERELKNTLTESSISETIKKLTTLNNDRSYKKKIADHIINFVEELQGTSGTQLGQVQGTGTSGGIDSYDLPLGGKRTKLFRRKGLRKGKQQ